MTWSSRPGILPSPSSSVTAALSTPPVIFPSSSGKFETMAIRMIASHHSGSRWTLLDRAYPVSTGAPELLPDYNSRGQAHTHQKPKHRVLCLGQKQSGEIHPDQ